MLFDQMYQEVTDIKNQLAQALADLSSTKLQLDSSNQTITDLTSRLATLHTDRDVIAQSIINAGKTYGKTKFNVPYAFGGDNFAEGGLDCSGFVKLLFDTIASTNLPRVSGNQSQAGQAVVDPQQSATPADLLFFTYDQRNNGLPTHVGIYIGNNQMLHTNNDTDRVHITTVNWPTVTCARRVF